MTDTWSEHVSEPFQIAHSYFFLKGFILQPKIFTSDIHKDESLWVYFLEVN